MHNSFILSNFNYCPVIVIFVLKLILKRWKKYKKKALKFIFSLSTKVKSHPVFLFKMFVFSFLSMKEVEPEMLFFVIFHYRLNRRL